MRVEVKARVLLMDKWCDDNFTSWDYEHIIDFNERYYDAPPKDERSYHLVTAGSWGFFPINMFHRGYQCPQAHFYIFENDCDAMAFKLRWL